ncbi:hypothetical protein [Rhizobium sp. BK251]|uniref:hypothetical protein n=1 Tax=Rhizobium sp. BK251 TaxID=2512125 RepID=UPI0014049FB0|nr:hypothetical protein [Rhizobium sp. BK251]
MNLIDRHDGHHFFAHSDGRAFALVSGFVAKSTITNAAAGGDDLRILLTHKSAKFADLPEINTDPNLPG